MRNFFKKMIDALSKWLFSPTCACSCREADEDEEEEDKRGQHE